MKLPLVEGPLCATRSASTKPGAGSFQSADVRTGMLRRSALAAGRRRARPLRSRIGCNARSMVAALIDNSFERISGASWMWPCRSIESSKIGIKAFSRLPHNRSRPPRAKSEHSVRLLRNATTDPSFRRARLSVQQSHRVLPVHPGKAGKLVKDTSLVLSACNPIALRQCRRQFLPRRHRQSPHRSPRAPSRFGSRLREATAQHSATFLARQCALSSRLTHHRTDFTQRVRDQNPRLRTIRNHPNQLLMRSQRSNNAVRDLQKIPSAT